MVSRVRGEERVIEGKGRVRMKRDANGVEWVVEKEERKE